MTDDCIKENISKINKNNIMVIDIGSRVSDAIFINKHTHHKINTIISTISNNSTSSSTIHTKCLVKSYFIKNIILDIYDKKINNYSYTVSATEVCTTNNKDYKVSILAINNNPNLTSNYKYNLIEHSLQTVIQYNNIFDIVITQFTEADTFYRFTLKIKKPLEHSLVMKEINYILSLF
jgi:hypothetical protein|tara:strand:+ start:152 stop:685 length:534 start_codon:yes stop_codon:yes gene_type:complete